MLESVDWWVLGVLLAVVWIVSVEWRLQIALEHRVVLSRRIDLQVKKKEKA